MTKDELRAAAPQSAAFVDGMREIFGPDLRVLRIVEGEVSIDKRPEWMKSVPRCTVPAAETQLGTLLRALQRGQRLTVAQALTEYGCYALSQRMGDLKRMGWPVLTSTITTNSGKRVAEYRMGAN
jgi:hypothetical protein